MASASSKPPAELAPAFPDAAYAVLRALEDAGYEAYFVGGCVRDTLMGRPVNDIDIATSARWEEATGACEARGMRAFETGIKHGTVTIVATGADDDGGDERGGEDEGRQGDKQSGREGRQNAEPGGGQGPFHSPAPRVRDAFEVTTYRIDSATSADGRHPDSVEFTASIEEDLARRDFTMNAMAWHPERGLVDPFGGRRDIARGVIRVVGEPEQRFKEDALRILRACRFASQLGFAIDDAAYGAMLARKCLLENVSTERVTHELDSMLLGAHVHDALLRCADVISFVLPELVAMKECAQPTKYHCFDVLEHTAWAVQHAEPERLVRWAALCHDMGKPACRFFDAQGVVHFYGHATVSARIARGLAGRLLMSGAFKDALCAIVEMHSDKIAPTPRSVKRALAKLGGDVGLFRSLLALKRADILAHAPEYRSQAAAIDEAEAVLDGIIAQNEAFSVRHLAVRGNDVMALGAEEGPDVGAALQALLDAVIDGEVANEREPLLAYARSHILCL